MLECGLVLKRFTAVLAPALALTMAAPAAAQQADTGLPPPSTPRPTAAALASEADLFQVDQRNPVNNPTGSFFNGLPLPNLGYSIRASLLSLYDSNYRRLPDSQQLAAGQSRSSFRFTPTINGRVNLPVGRQSLFATALIGKDYYTANSAYNRQRLAFSGGVNLAAGSSCTGSLNGSWVQAQSNPNSTVPQGGQQGILPNTQTTRSFGASASCGGVSGFTPTASYRYAKSTNQELARSFSDLTSNSYSVSLGYARPTLGVVSLFGTLSNNDYPNQIIPIVGTSRSVKITNLGVKYSRSLTSQFSADASLSRVSIDPNVPAQQKTNSLGYGLSVNYTPPSRISASINATRNASSSPNTGTALYFVQQAFSANVSYRLSSTLSTALTGSTSLRTYEDQVGVIINPNQVQNDRFNTVRLSVDWNPIRNMQTSFYVSQQNRNADPSIYNYKDTTAGILISYGI